MFKDFESKSNIFLIFKRNNNLFNIIKQTLNYKMKHSLNYKLLNHLIS